MTETPTIGGLLEKADAHYRVFEMGRRVTELPPSLFAQMEQGGRPYPYPLQRQAWLGILFWNRIQPDEHFVWFLRFPLDEMGLLRMAARDEFLNSVVQSLAHRQNPDGARIEQAHRESPFAFKPAGERMAAFHAQALVALRRPPSRFYAHARDYLSGRDGYDQWAFVGLQGLADLVARLEEDDNAALLAAAIPRLPDEPLTAVCRLLENRDPGEELAAALRSRLQDGLRDTETGPALVAALLRGLGARERGGLRREAFAMALESSRGQELEVLVAIAGRGWEALRDTGLRLRFLECLARCDAGDAVFAQVVGDLLFIPGMRPVLLESFRHEGRSDELVRAIGDMMGRSV